MTNLSISQQGLALILIENEISNNFQEVRRWQRRIDEAQQSLNEAKSRLTRNQEMLLKLQKSIAKIDLAYGTDYGYNTHFANRR